MQQPRRPHILVGLDIDNNLLHTEKSYDKADAMAPPGKPFDIISAAEWLLDPIKLLEVFDETQSYADDKFDRLKADDSLGLAEMDCTQIKVAIVTAKSRPDFLVSAATALFGEYMQVCDPAGPLDAVRIDDPKPDLALGARRSAGTLYHRLGRDHTFELLQFYPDTTESLGASDAAYSVEGVATQPLSPVIITNAHAYHRHHARKGIALTLLGDRMDVSPAHTIMLDDNRVVCADVDAHGMQFICTAGLTQSLKADGSSRLRMNMSTGRAEIIPATEVDSKTCAQSVYKQLKERLTMSIDAIYADLVAQKRTEAVVAAAIASADCRGAVGTEDPSPAPTSTSTTPELVDGTSASINKADTSLACEEVLADPLPAATLTPAVGASSSGDTEEAQDDDDCIRMPVNYPEVAQTTVAEIAAMARAGAGGFVKGS